MGIKWQDRVTDLEVLDRAGLVSIEAMIIKAQLHWTGYTIHMDGSLYGILAHGHRNLWRPKHRYKDCAKENLKYAGVAELAGMQQLTGSSRSLKSVAKKIPLTSSTTGRPLHLRDHQPPSSALTVPECVRPGLV